MKERENDAFKRIEQQLSKDQRHQQQRAKRAEKVRIQMEQTARGAVARYQREVKTQRPDAEQTITSIIQPWFSELVTSGRYDALLQWSTDHGGEEIRLSESILYYWPEDALKALRKGGNTLYKDTAEFVVDHYKGSETSHGIEIHADSDEVWYAGFELKTNRWDKTEGVRIWRQPVVGMGFGFAMISTSYDIPVDVSDIASSLESISPEVWIEFGQQIENGKALKAIEQSLKPRKLKISGPEEAGKRSEEAHRTAQQYFQNRKWH